MRNGFGYLVATVLLSAWPVVAKENPAIMRSGAGAYCTKHCDVMQLSKDLKTMESQIDSDRAFLKSSVNGERLTYFLARKEDMKRQLARHERELADIRAKLEKAEIELRELETKELSQLVTK